VAVRVLALRFTFYQTIRAALAFAPVPDSFSASVGFIDVGFDRSPRQLVFTVYRLALVNKGVSIGVLIPPPATYRPYAHPSPNPLPKPKPWQAPELDWADLASERRWEDAILSYLDLNGKTLLWRVVNSVVAETRPASRSLGRSAAREAPSAMMLLIRQARVKRHRRQWVTAVDDKC
jgi:hypothetical protein